MFISITLRLHTILRSWVQIIHIIYLYLYILKSRPNSETMILTFYEHFNAMFKFVFSKVADLIKRLCSDFDGDLLKSSF